MAMENHPPDPQHFKFTVGDLVHHKRYGYRGVIFERDASCKADDDWYEGNQTQPDRDQPWYHVLVHNATHTTYVAESNLEPDESGELINHPLRDSLFKTFYEGKYHKQNLN